MLKNTTLLTFLIVFFIISCGPSEPSPNDADTEWIESNDSLNFNRVPDETLDTLDQTKTDESSSKVSKGKALNAATSKKVPATTDGFINQQAGQIMDVKTEGNLNTFAIEDIYIKKRNDCPGSNCGKTVYLVNLNTQKTIEVLIQISWKADEKKEKQIRSYRVKKDDSLFIGCSQTCNSEKDNVKWNIIGAGYPK